MFSSLLWEGFLTGDSNRYKLINKPVAVEMEYLSP
jgi:hypothetical protein